MAVSFLCRRKGLFRHQSFGRLFYSCATSSPTHFPHAVFSACRVSVLDNKCPSLAMLHSSNHFGLQRRFSAEATSYPTPPPPGDFEDFPDAKDGDYESGAEDDDPPPDPEEGALYSPSESEN